MKVMKKRTQKKQKFLIKNKNVQILFKREIFNKLLIYLRVMLGMNLLSNNMENFGLLL